jgi:hypothetical protein
MDSLKLSTDKLDSVAPDHSNLMTVSFFIRFRGLAARKRQVGKEWDGELFSSVDWM